MPSPDTYITPVYCLDEHIAVRAYGDYPLVVPRSQRLAYGVDGAFDPSDRWKLTSSSVDFTTRAISAGNVIHLTKPSTQFKGGGIQFGIASVSASGLTLRVIGQDDGEGEPPAPAAGLSGVEFTIATFKPQIEDVSYQLNERFNIREPTSLNDQRVLREATVLMVLYRAYSTLARTRDGEYAMKAYEVEQDRDAAVNRVVLRWTNSDPAQQPTTLFSTRITR